MRRDWEVSGIGMHDVKFPKSIRNYDQKKDKHSEFLVANTNTYLLTCSLHNYVCTYIKMCVCIM